VPRRGDITRARGMTDVAKSAGITRQALYKALRPGSAPCFHTVYRVCTALGFRLVVHPLRPHCRANPATIRRTAADAPVTLIASQTLPSAP